MATTAQHIAARNDADLAQRLTAVAEQAGIANADQWVQYNRGRLVAEPIEGTTLADVHAYAVGTYVPTPRPGEDSTKITDVLLREAVDALWSEEQTPTSLPPGA